MANATEWPQHGGDYNEQRYSPLKQITADNVGQLGLAWYADMAEKGQWQSTPIVVDGLIYVTTPWSKIYAFDAVTGKPAWKYDPKVPREIAATRLCCNNSNRGATYYNGKVIWGTLDGRLVAVDAKKGTLVWEARTTDIKDDMSITGAPRIGDGKVFIGQGGGEYTSAVISPRGTPTPASSCGSSIPFPVIPRRARTTRHPTTSWPGPPPRGRGDWWKTGGGGTPWDGILYDPQTNLVIFGTGNGAPWPAGDRSPGGGDNLFIASIVAVNATTGKYAWHYQAVPAENFDFDNTRRSPPPISWSTGRRSTW